MYGIRVIRKSDQFVVMAPSFTLCESAAKKLYTKMREQHGPDLSVELVQQQIRVVEMGPGCYGKSAKMPPKSVRMTGYIEPIKGTNRPSPPKIHKGHCDGPKLEVHRANCNEDCKCGYDLVKEKENQKLLHG